MACGRRFMQCKYTITAVAAQIHFSNVKLPLGHAWLANLQVNLFVIHAWSCKSCDVTNEGSENTYDSRKHVWRGLAGVCASSPQKKTASQANEPLCLFLLHNIHISLPTGMQRRNQLCCQNDWSWWICDGDHALADNFLCKQNVWSAWFLAASSLKATRSWRKTENVHYWLDVFCLIF